MLKLDLDALRVQTFDTGPGTALSDLEEDRELSRHARGTCLSDPGGYCPLIVLDRCVWACRSHETDHPGCFHGPSRETRPTCCGEDRCE